MANYKINVQEQPINPKEIEWWVQYLKKHHTNVKGVEILRKQIQDHKDAIARHQAEIDELEQTLAKFEQLDPNGNIFENL